MEKHFKPAEMTRNELITWTRRILHRYGLKPKRKLSQNFIVNPFLLREILSYVDQDSNVLEIGCGLGTLSATLLEKSRSLVCIELDDKLCRVVKDIIRDPRFIVINANALHIPFVRNTVVSNIPYHVTSDLLVKIARENIVEKAVLTIQREVADRLIARPGSSQYGRLTILISLLFTIHAGNTYPPGSFYPEPEVEHRVIVLTRKRMYTEEIRALEELTRIIFTQRRRTLIKALVETTGAKREFLELHLGDLAYKRVYEIEPETWLKLIHEFRESGLTQS